MFTWNLSKCKFIKKQMRAKSDVKWNNIVLLEVKHLMH